MISAGDFRNGTTFEMDGNVFKVVEFQHVKPGKGSAFVRTKLKNMRRNTVSGLRLPSVTVSRQATIKAIRINPHCIVFRRRSFSRKYYKFLREY